MIDGLEPHSHEPRDRGDRIDGAAQIAKGETRYPRQKARGLTERGAYTP
jgi:hypothetical protein